MTGHDTEDRRTPQRGDAAHPTAPAVEAANHLGQDDANTKQPADQGRGGLPPRAPGGLSSGLQPGGTSPGKSPGASVGSIGTGGGSTGNSPSGAAKKGL
jgi:hypothetical protein